MDALRKAGDSCGARLTVVARGVPVGLGEPLYDKLDADIAYAMMGLNAVKGVEIGAGFGCVTQKGSEHGDELSPAGLSQQPRRRRARRHLHRAGPGGAHRHQADQLDPRCRARRSTAPASPRVVETHGRHDPCVGIRATPIAEALLALVVMDHALRHRAQCGDVRAAGAADSRRRRVIAPVTRFRTAPFGALWACYFGSLGLFNPYSPLWLSHLGYSTLAIGAFAALQSWTRIVAPYGWGWLADHGGRRVTLLRAGRAAQPAGRRGAVAGARCRRLGAGAWWWPRCSWPTAPSRRSPRRWCCATCTAAMGWTPGATAGCGCGARSVSSSRCWLFGVVLQRTGIGALPLLTLGMFALLGSGHLAAAARTWSRRRRRSRAPPSGRCCAGRWCAGSLPA